MRLLLVSFILLMVTGCSTVCTDYCKSSLITNDTVHVEPGVLELCKAQVPLSPNTQSFEEVLLNIKENKIIYNECASKQRDSVLIIKKFANIKDSK